jgi:hypothetical protein
LPVHTFTLTASLGTDAAAAEVWQQLQASPPAGCTYDPEVFPRTPGLRCERKAPTRLHAVFTIVGEVHAAHGLLLDDLSVEKLSEWIGDGADQPDSPARIHAADTAAQALLLAIDRLRRLGHDAAGIEAFTDLVLGRSRDVLPSGHGHTDTLRHVKDLSRDLTFWHSGDHPGHDRPASPRGGAARESTVAAAPGGET